MKRLIQIVLILVVLETACFAQWQAPAAGAAIVLFGTLFFLHGKVTEQECHNNQMWDVTYYTYIGLGKVNIVEQVEGPFGPCPCPVTGSQLTQPATDAFSLLGSSQPDRFSALRPREKNCTSGDKNGEQKPLPGRTAPGATGGFGGSGGGFAGGDSSGGPPGPPNPAGISGVLAALPTEIRLPPHAATSGSAFTYTLPFRNLPGGPLITESTAPGPFACNSSVNPTVFRVYHVDNVVKRTNLCTGDLVATTKVPDLPLQVRVTPDGSQAIVTSYSGAIAFISTASNTVSDVIQALGNPNFAPSGIAISPNGAYALVTNYLTPPDSYLTVVDVAGKQIKGKIPLDNEYPQSVFINPDGTLAWVTFPWDNSVEVVDILTGTIVGSLNVAAPFSIAFTPTGTRAFVSSGVGSVLVIDTATYQTIKTIPAELGATDLQITLDGAFVFVNNSQAQSVTVIDVQSLTGTTTNVGGAPQSAVIVPSQ